ncbi:hypothetical protein [Azonexus sp.]|uniref:hypothetical protein n=1 Tax=Azonexus sp. TaxID=1872668 RepID=UPI0027B9687C|nr:hypothetical protein [Azonexus sp.]
MADLPSKVSPAVSAAVSAHPIATVGAVVKSSTIGLGLGLLVMTAGLVFFDLAESDAAIYLALLPLLTAGLGLLLGLNRAKRKKQESKQEQ